MFNQGDKIKLLDGRIGRIGSVVKTESKTIYRILLSSSGEEGYFEEDKLRLVEGGARKSRWHKIRTWIKRKMPRQSSRPKG